MDDWREPLIEIGRALKDKFSTSGDTSQRDPSEFLRLISEGEYYRIHAGDLPAGQYAEIKKMRGISTLVFDPENIPAEILLEARETFNQTYEDLDGFALEGRGSIAAAIRSGEADQLFERIYDYYEYKIPRRFLPVLEDAITLRVVEQNENISQGELYDWRGEIADNHKDRTHDPKEAQNLISLCSAGYFDEGEYFKDLYATMVVDGPWDDRQYEEVFEKYVKNKPFVVFTKSDDMDYEEVCTLAIDKSIKLNKYPAPPGYIDLCAKGSDAIATIERAFEELQENHPGMLHERIKQEDRNQYIIRLDVDSL